MALFDLFKRKKVQPATEQKIDDDFNPLDMNSMTAYIKKKKPKATDKEIAEIIIEIAKPDSDLTHLTEDGELPWGWYGANKEFTDKIQNEFRYFLSAWLESEERHPREEYSALKSFVTFMNDVKSLCYSKGECYDYWRSLLFDDTYIEKRTEELESLTSNIVELTSKYEREQHIKEFILPGLKNKVIDAIRNNPGIIQKDLYKLFDDDLKPHISSELYELAKNGSVIRVKTGNSYQLIIP